MKRTAIVLILLIICTVTLCACTEAKPPVVDNPVPKSEMPDEEYFADENFQPVLRFSVASDIHINDELFQVEKTRLGKFFDVSYDYAINADWHNTLDAVVFVGDILTDGSEMQMRYFNAIVDEKIKTETQKIYLYGSHEYRNGGQDFIKKYNALFENKETGHVVINGFHFIYLSPDKGNTNNFSESLQTWLDEELAKAVAEDKTKPVFVFQHPHLADTVYGSESWSVPMLNHVLNKYPQVVDFSGHSHFPMADPRSIHQEYFTSLNTGGLSYYEMALVGYKDDHIFATDHNGHYATKSITKDQGEFYIVEVDQTGATRIIGYDLIGDREIVRYNLRTPADPSSYVYTDERYKTSEKPYFDDGAKITITERSDSGVTFTFPAAHCKDNVQHYKILIKKSGLIIDTEYVLSDTFFIDAPTSFTRTYDGKFIKEPYDIEIVAVSSFVKESDPLSITINHD